MKSILFNIVICILISSSMLCAQGESAVPFLVLYPPSTQLNSAAGAYTALPTDNPFGFIYNPAQLGQFSQYSNAAFQYDRRRIFKWSSDEVYFYNTGFSLGYNLKKINNNLPLSIGIGYMYEKLSWGEYVWTDETGAQLGKFEAKEYYNAFGIGACYDMFVKISMGLTYKRIVSDWGPSVIVGSEDRQGKANAFDFGLMFNIPLAKLLTSDDTIKDGLYPILELNYGYALLNVGDEIYYLDKTYQDPLPRLARLGNALQLGIGIHSHGIDLDILKFEYSSESNDILVKRDTSGSYNYQGLFGDLNVFKSLIYWDDNKKIMLRRGLRLNLLETVQVSLGFIDNYYSYQVKPTGYTLSLKGIAKVLTIINNDHWSNNLVNHFDLRFSYTVPDLKSYNSVRDTKFWGIQFIVYGY